jgi:polyisoprenoid-binding protein YceI
MAGAGCRASAALVTGLMVVIAGAAWTTLAHAGDTALSSPKVTFTASSSNGGKIVGSGTQLKLEVKGSWLIFKVPLSAVSTQIEARDRQMRDRYLEADTHPAVELRLARDGLNVPKSDGATEGNANAKLKLHGKTREIIVHYIVERKGAALKVKSSFRIDLRSYGIDLPSYRGITVRPDVDVEVAFGSIDREVVADAQ